MQQQDFGAWPVMAYAGVIEAAHQRFDFLVALPKRRDLNAEAVLHRKLVTVGVPGGDPDWRAARLHRFG